MWTVAILLTLTLAQAPDATDGPVYRFVQQDEQTIYGHIVREDERGYVIEVDSPWRPGQRTITILKANLVKEPEIETRDEARKRHSEGERAYLISQGLEPVETAEGLIGVPRETYQLAERAREMALQVEAERRSEKDAAEEELEQLAQQMPPEEAATTQDDGASAPMTRYFYAGGVLLVGLVLCIVILKTMVLA